MPHLHPDRPTALADALPGLAPVTRAVTESVLRLPVPERMQVIRDVAEALELPSHGVDKLLEGADLIVTDWEDDERQPWPQPITTRVRMPNPSLYADLAGQGA